MNYSYRINDRTEVRVLSREQVKSVYYNHMENDFPEQELKPLKMMYRMLDDGVYECLGLYADGELAAYAYIIHTGKTCLLDYFAAVRERRSQGYGSLFLQHLKDYLSGEDMLIIESEDPDFYEDEEDRITRCRRLDFYRRNGFRDTGARALLFGVRYTVLEPDTDSHSRNEISTSYRELYRTVLSEKHYRENVEIH